MPNGTWAAGFPPLAGSNIFVRSQFNPTLPAPPLPPAMLMPARQWHLARRSVLILDQAVPGGAEAHNLDDGAGSADPYCLREGRRDYVIDRDPDPSPPPAPFDFGAYVRNLVANLPLTPHNDVKAIPFPTAPAYDPPPGTLIPWFARSQMDLDPPPTQARRLGHYMLPNCASFKVEWLLEDPVARELGELIWIDPIDPKGSLEALKQLTDDYEIEPKFDALIEKHFDPTDNNERFYPEEVGSNHIFYANVLQDDVAVPDPLFPRALRVTIDVYDRAGRLERPIRHVMILRVGEG